jgi:hypothetical protein
LDINLNPEKCMFLVFSGVILGYIMFKEGKLLDPKKITTKVNMSKQKTPKDIQVFNNIPVLSLFLPKLRFHHGPDYKIVARN